MNTNNDFLQSFLIVYFYKIEFLLNKNSNGLENLKFQSEESNTDEHLKLFFQNFITNNNDISGIEIKELLLVADDNEYSIKISNLLNYKIKQVLLPEELSEDQKQTITSRKKSVYTSPDLYLKITDGQNIMYESVELKSTKNDKIPGSSIQQISPFEWVIFIKRNNDSVSVTTGFYINSITDKLPFPDRSPRPQIGFKNLLDWNNQNRKVESNILKVENVTEVNNEKLKLLEDWQDFLASEWLSIIRDDRKKKNEKWFNNAIRKFALKLLRYSEALSEKDKNELTQNLNKLIE